MTKLKKVMAFVLAMVMMTCTFSATVFAAESENQLQENMMYECYFEITPNMEGKEVLLSTSEVDNTFTVTGEHTGKLRTYSGSRMRYVITITDSNGNRADNILAVRLYDSNDTLKSEDQFWADGSVNVIQDIPLTGNKTYYFKYLLAYGTVRPLKVHMVISTY